MPLPSPSVTCSCGKSCIGYGTRGLRSEVNRDGPRPTTAAVTLPTCNKRHTHGAIINPHLDYDDIRVPEACCCLVVAVPTGMSSFVAFGYKLKVMSQVVLVPVRLPVLSETSKPRRRPATRACLRPAPRPSPPPQLTTDEPTWSARLLSLGSGLQIHLVEARLSMINQTYGADRM